MTSIDPPVPGSPLSLNGDADSDSIETMPTPSSSSSKRKNLWANRSVSEVDDLHFNSNLQSASEVGNGSQTNSVSAEDAEATLLSRTVEDYFNGIEVPFEVQNRKWLYRLPVSFERFTEPFDTPVLRWTQRTLSGRLAELWALAITAVFAIEVIVVMPYVFFILGWDQLAIEFTYLVLLTTTISQIPKRFLWRFRPYMVHRARTVRKDATSSFPSRAVTCSVVYTYALCFAYNHLFNPKHIFAWWMLVVLAIAIVISSVARISLGVHYPSDCVAGVLQGLFITGIGVVGWKLDVIGCASCDNFGCYTTDSDMIAWSNLAINWWMFAISLAVMTLVAVLSIIRPLQFWVKCDRVYGTLFPCILFQLVFLCPRTAHTSLPPPPHAEWYTYVFGILTAIVATAVGIKLKCHSILRYSWVFLFVFACLAGWRLSITNHL